MKIDKNVVRKLLPEKIRECCLIGICNPKYLDGLKPVYLIKNKKWSATPREIFPNTKSVIVLIHFSPVANDYRVEKLILDLGGLLWKELGLKTHIINKSGKTDSTRLIGTESGPSSERYDRLILLKPLAYYAGLGQYGKSSLIINSQFGSDFKIQSLFTQEKLKYDYPMVLKEYPGCNNCNQCIELCPGEALSNYQIDPLKCPILERPENLSKGIAKPYLLSLILVRKVKAKGYLFDYNCCRNCQAFCKANLGHYIKL